MDREATRNQGCPRPQQSAIRPVHSRLNPCTQRRLCLPHKDVSKADRVTYLTVCTFYNTTVTCTDS